MAYDFNGGFSTLSLRKPSPPIKIEAPDAKQIFLHYGEDAGQYQSFIEAVSDLAQAFKFLPKYDQMKYQYGSPTAATDPALLDEYKAALAEGGWADDAEFMAETFSKQADPTNENLIWGQGLGRAYSNLEFSPDASDWNLLEGVDLDDGSILNEIKSYFDWEAIRSIGAGQSFYQIAKSGAISTYSDEQAFDLMCSMTESKERVFVALKSIFGEAEKLDAHEDLNLNGIDDVIDHISSWLDDRVKVDSHNLGILKMFFGMQADFINTLDAYMNCQTYWGGDLTNPSNNEHSSCTLQPVSSVYTYDLGNDHIIADSDKVYDVNGVLMTRGTDYTIDYKTGQITFSEEVIAIASEIKIDFDYNDLGGFSDTLKTKVESYISTLSGDKQSAAESLESIWFSPAPRYDRVGDNWTGELVGTEGSWVNFFQGKMDEFNSAEVIRVISCSIMRKSAD